MFSIKSILPICLKDSLLQLKMVFRTILCIFKNNFFGQMSGLPVLLIPSGAAGVFSS
jgi:hypothetical protein